MEKAQITPKKSLGQHFLVNESISRRITNLLKQVENDQILEIGPGPGALTKYLANAPYKKLVLIEKDTVWAREHAKNNELTVYELDALQFDWANLSNSGQWKLIGNLPYNVASPLIWNIVSQCSGYSKAVFMVQKEVAQRICAKSGTRQYGALSAWVQSFSHPIFEFTVSPGSFRPQPKVDSAIITLTPLSQTVAYPYELKLLLDLCFQQRRKQLGTIFKKSGYPDLLNALEILQIDPGLRPETLTPGQFQKLAAILHKQL